MLLFVYGIGSHMVGLERNQGYDKHHSVGTPGNEERRLQSYW